MAATTTFDFKPDSVAYYEVEGWKAYYDRAWLKLLRLLLGLIQEQFHIPFPASLRAAYFVTRASVAWVPTDHDMNKIRAYNTAFYRLAKRYSKLNFDPERAGNLETQYWDVHRRLVKQTDKTEFIETMTDLHATLFGLTRDEARESAEQRVIANNVLDTITGKTSPDPAADWKRCEDHLKQCYNSIRQALITHNNQKRDN